MTKAVAVLAAIFGVLSFSAGVSGRSQGPVTTRDTRPADFFNPAIVRSVHLSFTKAEWAAMQPQYGQGNSYGGFGRGMGGGLLGAEGARNGVAAARGVEFDYVHADLQLDGLTFSDVGVRFKGNGTFFRSQASGKTSLKLDLNKYVKGQKLGGLSTINLQNCITDASWMNEVLAYRLYRDAGVPAPRSSYARVYVTAEGAYTHEYFGLYTILENVDTNFVYERFGTRDGAILKPSTRSVFADLGDDWAAYNQSYDPKTDLTRAEIARIIEFSRFLTRADDAEFRARVGEYIDLEPFARYLAVLAWIGNTDSLLGLGQNYYVYLTPDTHKFQWIAWDQDGSFGNFGRNGSPESMSILRPGLGSIRLIDRLLGVEAFKSLYLARLREFTATVFDPGRFADQMKALAPVIRPAIVDESARQAADFDRAVAGGSGIQPFTQARHRFVAGELESLGQPVPLESR